MEHFSVCILSLRLGTLRGKPHSETGLVYIEYLRALKFPITTAVDAHDIQDRRRKVPTELRNRL